MHLSKENLQFIRNQFIKMELPSDLVLLLNQIYKLKFSETSKKCNVLIQEKDLNYYAFKCTNRYESFTLKKKSGGERIISAPRYKLKTIQKCINEILNAVFTPHFTATGFIPKKNIVDNSKVHIGKQFVYNTDLKDFFGSIEFRRVKVVLGLHPFNLIDKDELMGNKKKEKISDQKGRGYLGFLIANICCDTGSLPQGAPTSPTLTNIVCQRLDKKLYKFAKSINSTYSRYADDITFSSNKKVFDEDFKKKMISIIEVQENFKINFSKERLQTSGERQIVTGIIVNKKCNLERIFIKDIRFWLMCWNKFGLEAAEQRFASEFPNKKGFARKGGSIPHFQNYLLGKILFLGMVRGQIDRLYLATKRNFENLNNNMVLNSNTLPSLMKRTNIEIKVDSEIVLEILKELEQTGFSDAIIKYNNSFK